MEQNSLREIPFEVLGLVFSWISESEQAIISQVSKNFQFIIDKKIFEIEMATAVSSIPLLQWAMRNGLPRTDKVTKSSIICGKLDVLRYLAIKLKFPLSIDGSCILAARGGYLEILRALRSGELGGVYPWNEWTCEEAAEGGHFEVLKALRSGELGEVCPWDQEACTQAAYGGHLGILRALRSGELGGVCPWDKWSCIDAARGDHLEVLRALRSGELGGEKCPWDKSQCLQFSRKYQYVQDLINSGELDD